MSDLDKLFENAPEGATEIVAWGNNLTWANETKMYSLVREYWVERDSGWQTIATRPEPERKTVEDAVDAFGGEWPNSRFNLAWYNPERNEILLGCNHTEDTICTREQFEACVAAKDKSEPKWTHKYGRDNCYIKASDPDCDGYIVVVTECDGYNLAMPDELKPIKPTITEHKALDLMKTMCPDEWAAVERKYNITN